MSAVDASPAAVPPAPAPAAPPAQNDAAAYWTKLLSDPAFRAMPPEQRTALLTKQVQEAHEQGKAQQTGSDMQLGQTIGAVPKGKPVHGKESFSDIVARTPSTMVGNPKGLIEPGNIDIMSRPRVKNKDGSVSTVRSMSFQDKEGGPEILVPTVAHDGSRILSDDEAIDQFHRSGKHLGKFKTPEHATSYAAALHEQQQREGDQGNIATTPAHPLDQALADPNADHMAALKSYVYGP